MSKRINPLHSIDLLVQQMVQTGCYPDPERCTGRSTALALQHIAEAIRNPYTWINTVDHLPQQTLFLQERMADECRSMIQRLGLQYFVFRKGQICFGNPR